MRTLVILLSFFGFISVTQAQDCYIVGQQDIECIEQDIYTYYLRCDSIEELQVLDWTITPEQSGADLIFEQGNEAGVFYYGKKAKVLNGQAE